MIGIRELFRRSVVNRVRSYRVQALNSHPCIYIIRLGVEVPDDDGPYVDTSYALDEDGYPTQTGDERMEFYSYASAKQFADEYAKKRGIQEF